MTTSTIQLPCWIHHNKRHYLRGKTLRELPYVDLEYENILKANDIPYRKVTMFVESFTNKTKDVLEYWNPEMGLEEEDLTLPLYAQMPNRSYKYCQKNYTQKVPTEECIKAAKETQLFILEKIHEYEQILREVRHYEFAKEKLANGVVTTCFSDVLPYTSFYEINMNNDHFIVFRIPSLVSVSDWVVIFNMNKVARNGHLTIQIPEEMVGFTIGKYGANIHEWEEILKVKKINVVPI